MATVIPKKSKKGFTLVELVVVIAILAILAAIAIPIVNNLVNAASRNAAVSDAQTIELAVKECQSFIVTKVDEVYDGATMLDGMSLSSQSPALIVPPEACLSAYTSIYISCDTEYLRG